MLLERGERLREVRDDLRSGALGFFKRHRARLVYRKDIADLKKQTYLLQLGHEEFKACLNVRLHNVLIPWAKLFLGVLSAVVNALLISDTLVAAKYRRGLFDAFLRLLFESVGAVFGALALGALLLYVTLLVFCGHLNLGLLLLPFFDVHPLRVDATTVAGFLFNAELALFCNLAVAQFASTLLARLSASTDFVRYFSAVSTRTRLFAWAEKCRFFEYLTFAVFALLVVGVGGYWLATRIFKLTCGGCGRCELNPLRWCRREPPPPALPVELTALKTVALPLLETAKRAMG